VTLKIPKNKTLYPFQVEGVEKMLAFMRANESHGCYLADQMGLGKSCQALVTINELKLNKILIICPAIMRLTWRDEIMAWAVGNRTRVAPILKSEDLDKNTIDIANYLIISYDLAARTKCRELLTSIEWDCLILDEAHYIKSHSAKRTKEILKHIWPKAKNRILLSGTPFTQSVVDGFTAFNRLLPSKFPTFYDFVGRYAYAQATPWGVKYTGVKNHEELSALIRSNFYVRRRKDEVLKDLPPKTFQKLTLGEEYLLKVPQNDRETLAAQVRAVVMKIERGESVGPVPHSLASQKRLQGELKVPAVVDFVRDLMEQDIPVVVFGWHTKVLTAIDSAFREASDLTESNPAFIDGSISSEVRHAEVERFQSGKTNLFIGQMAAAGVGITLTRSCTVVLAELDWSPGVIAQAVDRVHRITQVEPVTVYYFVVENSIDETLTEVVMDKAKTFSKVLDSDADR
jgi:SWI/SNF-related matrix-associated actin-dependent regulator of chromatin subfamily A-like protein 1